MIAAASTQEKVDLAVKHGAESGVVYPTGTFDKDGKKALGALFKDAVPKDGVDVIYDGVGGDYAEAALRAMAWEGRFLVIGFPAGIPSIPLNLALLKGCQIVGVFWGSFTTKQPADNQQNIKEMLQALRRRQDQALRLGQVPAGASRSGHHRPRRTPRAGQGGGDDGRSVR